MRGSGLNALEHYILYGASEGRDPHPLFDVSWYCKHNDNAAANPLLHYLSGEGRDPHPMFDASWYLRQLPDFPLGKIDPLIHFLTADHPLASPHPLFDARWYLDRYPDVRGSGLNALEHYILYGASEGRDPHPLFDVSWYCKHNDNAAANPLLHYLSGKGRNPHPLFDEAYYRSQIEDLDFDDPPLLLHFVVRGALIGYNPNSFFDCNWYVNNHETLWQTGENPLAHFVHTGVFENRDPHPLFDVDWYLYKNPDVAQSGMNPLDHFLSSGRSQGRTGHPPDAADENCSIFDIPYEIRRHPVITGERDVCVLVTYSRDGSIYPHTRFYLEALQANNIDVILAVVTDGLNQPLPSFTESAAGLVVRINHGWDFAAWATVLAAIPDVWSARSLILTNDSIFGPTDASQFQELLRRMRASEADIIALTDSYQAQHHLMSFFTVLKNRALTSKHIHNFWNNIRSIRDKQTVINCYELSSKQLVTQADLRCEVMFPTKKRADRDRNPTLEDWRGLIESGFPFVKVQLLRERDRLGYCNTEGWRELLAGNPPLLDAIDAYLESANSRGMGEEKVRPVPGPHRRFDRSARLATFYGSIESTRPNERTDLCLEVPFRWSIKSTHLPEKVAVIAHIFYTELCIEILAAIANIPVRADVFISTDSSEKAAEIERYFSDYEWDVTVEVFPNVGRDIAPMIVGYRRVFDNYDIFLHIHSKQSLHTSRLATWRSFLISNLLGSREIVSSILCLLNQTDVGIVFSDHFKPVRNLLNWGGNYNRVRLLLRSIGVDISKDIVLDFPSSSFFWGRSKALRSLLELQLDWSDFECEAGQIDGTLAHAIERAILYFAEDRGFSWTKVGRTDNVSSERLIPVWDLEDVERTRQRLLGNRLPPLSDRNLIPELVSFCSRPDRRALRPRFNLIIPTLAPERIFGGITTALRIFNEIAEALGPGFDIRIICQSLPVDLRAMLGLSGYCLVPMGARDNFAKTVVDLSDQESGELSLRANDVFLSTAWWTATVGFELQRRQRSYFWNSPKILYLIQDHEPDFYGWCAQYSLAQETYRHPDKTIALINSEELSRYMCSAYSFNEAYLVRFKINPEISKNLQPLPRERIICIYARPGTPRNAFPLLCAGIAQWQRNNPTRARTWRIVAAGEAFPSDRAGSVVNLSVAGKLSLEEYGDLLSRASVGISLMLSPHPSYPPLEMAAAGLQTVTNNFFSKDLSQRSANILSIRELSADSLSAAIEIAVDRGEGQIGRVVGKSEIAELESAVPDFVASVVAGRIRAMTESS
ncbi:rhamnosyltransferase WsaF family glycosyltransferase [Methylobacterium sp. A52T]